MLIAPVTTTEEVLATERFEERGFWEVVAGLRFPGRFARFLATPLEPLGSAPKLGEYTSEVLEAPVRVPATPKRQPDGVRDNQCQI